MAPTLGASGNSIPVGSGSASSPGSLADPGQANVPSGVPIGIYISL